MGNTIYFASVDGEELFHLDHIESCELEVAPENTSDKCIRRFIQGEEWSCSFEMDPESVERFEKQIIYDGDKGRYNGHVLRRDGYLSPKNAWI